MRKVNRNSSKKRCEADSELPCFDASQTTGETWFITGDSDHVYAALPVGTKPD